jgi:Tfp pilus assembly protein PilF
LPTLPRFGGGDLQEARELSEKAVSLSPRVAGYHDTLARIHDKLGNHAAAHASFDAALAADGTYVDALVGKADLLMRDGQLDQVRALMPQIELAVQKTGPLPEPLNGQLQTIRKALQ